MKVIPVAVPDNAYAVLAALAHLRGDSVASMVTRQTMGLARTYAAAPPIYERIARLHAERKTIPEIAAELGETNAAIARRLRRMELVPNPAPRAIADPRQPNPRARSKK